MLPALKILFFILFAAVLGVAPVSRAADGRKAAVSSLDTKDLIDFEKYPKPVQTLIEKALDLTKRNLTYRFASADPANGGMDCSGTVYHVLQSVDIDRVPRQSDEMCQWVIDKGLFHRTESVATLEAAVFANLKPGDLLFWSGTYEHAARKLPVSHVMIYLGKRTSDGKPVVFGASDGRSYDGQRRCGVSVFDFKIPKPDSGAEFYGYGPVPGLLAQTKEEVRRAKKK